MDLGVHLPLMEFGDEGQSLARLRSAVDAARACDFAAVSANDHFVFSAPWLDGPTALAAVADRTGEMTVATTISLVVLRGPVPAAKMLAALDVLTQGRLVAGLGPGSSKKDYDALGVPFEERWQRFDEAAAILHGLVGARLASTRRSLLPAAEGGSDAAAAPIGRNSAVDRKLGLRRRPAPSRTLGGWVARLRVQHDARALRRGTSASGR